MILGFIGIGGRAALLDSGALCFLVFSARVAACAEGGHATGETLTLDRLIPREHYTEAQISPHFWPNGKMPVREDWKELAADGFKDYKLKVSGMVENPVELSIDDMRALEAEESITMHHCIQGWSGIAQWGGVSMSKLIELVKPEPYAKVVAFYSFGGSLYGGLYYDTQKLDNALKPECLLAFEMNGEPLPPSMERHCGCEWKTSLATKWSSGSSALNSSSPRSSSAKAKAVRTKTTSTSICCRTSK